MNTLANRLTPTLVTNLHTTPGWNQPDNAGNTGGRSSAPHGPFNFFSLPSANIAVAQVQPAIPYDTWYFWHDLAELDHPIFGSRFASQISFVFPSAKDIAACKAFEWEMEMTVAGEVHNMGWQMLVQPEPHRDPGLWAFDYNQKVWTSPNRQPIAPLPRLKPDLPITVITEHTISNHTVEHMAITIDGTETMIKFHQPSTPNVYPGANSLHAAFQLDGDARATPYTVALLNYDMAYI